MNDRRLLLHKFVSVLFSFTFDIRLQWGWFQQKLSRNFNDVRISEIFSEDDCALWTCRSWFVHRRDFLFLLNWEKIKTIQNIIKINQLTFFELIRKLSKRSAVLVNVSSSTDVELLVCISDVSRPPPDLKSSLVSSSESLGSSCSCEWNSLLFKSKCIIINCQNSHPPDTAHMPFAVHF